MIGIEMFYLGWFCLDKEGEKNIWRQLAICASPIIQNCRVLAMRVMEKDKIVFN